MLPRLFVWLFFMASLLYGAFVDDDMDGVANEDDRCPDSALTDIVGADGCAVKRVAFRKEHLFDLSVGYSYIRYDANLSQDSKSLSLGYRYGNFSALLYASDYDLKTGESGAGDTTVAVYYRGESGDIAYKAGVGCYLPTDEGSGNRSDYFIESRIVYYLGAFDGSLAYQHTFMQDIGTRDSDRLTLSVGCLPGEHLYTALSYTTQRSIYRDEKSLQSAALYIGYAIGREWSLSAELSKGLSESASDLSYGMRLGYYF